MEELTVEPLTRDAFTPFGEVMQLEDAQRRLINAGTTERFHQLATVDTKADGQAIVSIFRGQPRRFPFEIAMMERHPLGSQAFFPLAQTPWLAVVAEDRQGRPAKPRVFRVSGRQGVNYRRNVWHHPLIALDRVSDFIVVDRAGPDDNLEERDYPAPYVIKAPEID